MSRIKRLVATAALGALVLAGAAGGASAAGPGEGMPGGLPQQSCLGQINANGVLLDGQTPAEQAAEFGYETVAAWEQAQLACKTAVG
jgi:hypothetical protein